VPEIVPDIGESRANGCDFTKAPIGNGRVGTGLSPFRETIDDTEIGTVVCCLIPSRLDSALLCYLFCFIFFFFFFVSRVFASLWRISLCASQRAKRKIESISTNIEVPKRVANRLFAFLLVPLSPFFNYFGTSVRMEGN
jgi:hypothetical protein